MKTFSILLLFSIAQLIKTESNSVPLVINTWSFTGATEKAWEFLNQGHSGVDSIEAGLTACEIAQCDTTVGYGGSPDENGETTLDAMIFDGTLMDMGAVGALRHVKHAASVAKLILEKTKHSLLVGSQATDFAIDMGFQNTSLSTNFSYTQWYSWKNANCQPNFWRNVEPNPHKYCGPYTPISENSVYSISPSDFDSKNHDTIGMIIIDANVNIVAGTSSNGANHKIPGRVGDSPLPGAGAYADSAVGAAVATGDGDVMMRFLPSFLAVEELRRGSTPLQAARVAIHRIASKYSEFFGGVVVANAKGEYGAACNGMTEFPFSVINRKLGKVVVENVKCL